MSTYNKQQLIQMVQKIMDCEDDEDTIDDLIEILEESVPHPALSDLIYWPPNDEELSAEEIVDIALSYKWNEHQNKCYSKTMKELIVNCNKHQKLNITIKDILPQDFIVSVKPVSLIHGMNDIRSEVRKNTINLSNLFSEFEKQLLAVEQLENWLKEIYPNKIFCSYFVYQKGMTSTFQFHMEYPNMDWISDAKIKTSRDCIRKNTF